MKQRAKRKVKCKFPGMTRAEYDRNFSALLNIFLNRLVTKIMP